MLLFFHLTLSISICPDFQEVLYLPLEVSFSWSKLRHLKAFLKVFLSQGVSLWLTPGHSLIGPLQLLSHGVTGEHILVQFSECLSTALVTPLLSQIPNRSFWCPTLWFPSYSLPKFTVISSAIRLRSSWTSSLKHILGPNHPVPSASDPVLTPDHWSRIPFTLGLWCPSLTVDFGLGNPKPSETFQEHCPSNGEVLSILIYFLPRGRTEYLFPPPVRVMSIDLGSSFKGELRYK